MTAIVDKKTLEPFSDYIQANTKAPTILVLILLQKVIHAGLFAVAIMTAH